MSTDLVSLAARYGRELAHTTNPHLQAIDEIFSRSPKYNLHRSMFRYMHGQLRASLSGAGNGTPPDLFLCFGYLP